MVATLGWAGELSFRLDREVGTSGRGRDELERPAALAIADRRSEDFWVADGKADTLIRFTQRGKWLSTIKKLPGAKPEDFKRPSSLAFDRLGRLWVLDSGHDRILVMDADGALAKQIGDRGIRRGAFRDPEGIEIAPDGKVYVADTGNDRIQVLDQNGEVEAVWTYAAGPSRGWLKKPAFIQYSPEGDGLLWVAQKDASQVVKCDLKGKWVGTVDLTALVQSDVKVRGVAVDRTMERLFVCDALGRRVLVVGWRGDLLAEIPLPEGVEIGAIAVNWHISVFIADAAGSRVLVYDRE